MIIDQMIEVIVLHSRSENLDNGCCPSTVAMLTNASGCLPLCLYFDHNGMMKVWKEQDSVSIWKCVHG
jgi:hypothetical protein